MLSRQIFLKFIAFTVIRVSLVVRKRLQVPSEYPNTTRKKNMAMKKKMEISGRISNNVYANETHIARNIGHEPLWTCAVMDFSQNGR